MLSVLVSILLKRLVISILKRIDTATFDTTIIEENLIERPHSVMIAILITSSIDITNLVTCSINSVIDLAE